MYTHAHPCLSTTHPPTPPHIHTEKCIEVLFTVIYTCHSNIQGWRQEDGELEASLGYTQRL